MVIQRVGRERGGVLQVGWFDGKQPAAEPLGGRREPRVSARGTIVVGLVGKFGALVVQLRRFECQLTRFDSKVVGASDRSEGLT